MTETTYASGPWYEIQGLSLCPTCGDEPSPTCSVPAEGEWHGIYHLDSMYAAKKALSHVIVSDEQIYDRYDDFRIAQPNPASVRRVTRERNKRDRHAGKAA